MVFNATFNNIAIISWHGERNRITRRKPSTCRKSLTKFNTYYCIKYTLTGFELTTLVVIGIDCTGSCKSNYHLIMTTTAPSV